MAAKRAHTPAAGRLPHAHGAIARATGRELSVRAERQAPDFGCVALQVGKAATTADVPQLKHTALSTAARRQPAIRAECHPPHLPRTSVDLDQTPTGARI